MSLLIAFFVACFFTHPDFAKTLVDPLFAFGRKRVVGGEPSLPFTAERVVKRSDDRVSQQANALSIIKFLKS